MRGRKDANLPVGTGERRRRFWFGTLSSLSALLVALPVAAADNVIYLKQNKFRIPVHVAANKTNEIKELRLFVSADRGKSWKLLKTADPTRDVFDFRAQADGEYWFTLAHVDHEGKSKPEDPATAPPELKVIIDTQVPAVELQSTAASNNRATIAWQISDETLDPSSLRIEVLAPGQSEWSEVSVAKSPTGNYELPVEAGKGYSVRARVKDRAGNESEARVEITGPAATTEPAVAQAAVPAEPMPRPAATTVPEPNRLAIADEPMEMPARPTPPTPAAPIDVVAAPAPAPVSQTIPQAVAQRDKEPAKPEAAAVPVFDRSKPDLPADKPAESAEAATPEVQPAVANVDRNVMLAQRIPVATTQAPKVRAVSATVPAPAAKPEPPPAPKRIPLVNSRSFVVNYQLKGSGPAGLAKVEMYYTKDNGQTWTLFGEDTDRVPPFQVNLPEEGRYGLQVVPTSRGGWSKAPKAGDEPGMVIEVDTTPPEAELYQPYPDPDASLDALLISWSARDLHLPDGPVSLYFAERAEGPWYAIRTDLPTTGQYSWRIPEGVPHEVYLRLLVRDLADNVSVADTPEPVLIDLSRPEATVIGIANVPGQRY